MREAGQPASARQDSPFISARQPPSGRRAFLFATSFVLCGQFAAGDETNCDALPESKRDLCWMVVACGAMDSRERREECLRVAAETLRAQDDGDEPPAAVGRHTAVADPSPPAEAARTPVAVDAVDAGEPAVGGGDKGRRWFRRNRQVAGTAASNVPARKSTEENTVNSAIVSQTVAREVLTIPRRFSAVVTAHVPLVRDRQLLVLDGKLLFEADNRRSGALGEGTEVEVVKASSRRGRSFQIMGPSKRAVSALRIRCESADLTRDTRRKCALLDRGRTSE